MWRCYISQDKKRVHSCKKAACVQTVKILVFCIKKWVHRFRFHRLCVCLRRELWPRDSSCVSSARGASAASPTRMPECSSRFERPPGGGTCVFALYSLLGHSPSFLLCQAFLGVCDVLTAHSYQLQVWDPASFAPLLYTPSPKLQRALLAFVCAHVFVGADGYSQCNGEARFMFILFDCSCAHLSLKVHFKLVKFRIFYISKVWTQCF